MAVSRGLRTGQHSHASSGGEQRKGYIARDSGLFSGADSGEHGSEPDGDERPSVPAGRTRDEPGIILGGAAIGYVEAPGYRAPIQAPRPAFAAGDGVLSSAAVCPDDDQSGVRNRSRSR